MPNIQFFSQLHMKKCSNNFHMNFYMDFQNIFLWNSFDKNLHFNPPPPPRNPLSHVKKKFRRNLLETVALGKKKKNFIGYQPSI